MQRRLLPVLATLLATLTVAAVSSTTRAQSVQHPWRVSLGLGAESWLSRDIGALGSLFLDARRGGVAGGQLHFRYNSSTLQAGLENIRMAEGKVELSLVARGEALFTHVLFNYYQRGVPNPDRGFFASYVLLLPSVKLHPADRHSIEVVLGVRRWFFGRSSSTEADFTLPPDTFVFEPRLNYTYRRIRAPGTEWEPYRIYPRIEGVAFGVSLGLDRRTDRRAWGADVGGRLDPRNNPGDVVLLTRQWLVAGVSASPLVRFQFEQHASYGSGEDDVTRSRLGGMNPYVVPVAGLPWAAALSERLATLQVALHVKPRLSSLHELGVGLDCAVFSDPRRTGQLSHYGGAGGAYAFGDFRFGRFQLHGRFGYALPTRWLSTSPNVSLLLYGGMRLR